MLDDVRIRNLGVIRDASLPLGPGLTVVTGETGAGKTMVVTSLLLLFGGRSDATAVAASAATADVEGRLRVPADAPSITRALDAGGELDDDGSLILSRSVSTAGRSRATVGGRSVPVGVLAEIAETVLAVHGQAQQLRLTRPAQQRDVLDRYAAAGDVKTAYAAAYTSWQHLDADLADRRAHQGERRREAELLSFALAQIDAAAPRTGEDDELDVEVSRLAGSDALRQAATVAHAALAGDDTTPDAATVGDLLGTARKALDDAAHADPQLGTLAERVRELAYLSTDVAAELSSYATDLDDDPVRLGTAMDRRALLSALVGKYADGSRVDDLITWADSARGRLAELDTSDETLAALADRRDRARSEAATRGQVLTGVRRAAGERFEQAVSTELTSLAMGAARIVVGVRPRTPGGGPTVEVEGQQVGAGPDGVDEVSIELVSYAGDTPRPLGKGASGGELSRIMLAVEVALAGADPVPTMIFDEVDAGVGGQAAVEIGRRLAALGRDHQVIAVTHLPQVAAYADRHIVIEKSGAGSVTRSDVRVLDDDARVIELSRMLAGLTDSESGQAHARDLLAAAASDKLVATSRRSRPAVRPKRAKAGKRA